MKTQSDTAVPAEVEAVEQRRGGRPPAGTDPQKRRQILEGGSRVFSTVGFDAASMSDVAREAGVSKATLYVYFEDKEHLFTAVCGERRDRNIGELIAMLDTSAPIEETLKTLSTEMLQRVTQSNVLAAHRIIIGVAERMPDVGREFFETGPLRLVRAFASYLDVHVANGTLKMTLTPVRVAPAAAVTAVNVPGASLFDSVAPLANSSGPGRLRCSVEKPPSRIPST